MPRVKLLGDGYASGHGYGYGYGSGHDDGSGDGNGFGAGHGDGDGYGYGSGAVSGSGDGYGSGSGYGDGYCDGNEAILGLMHRFKGKCTGRDKDDNHPEDFANFADEDGKPDPDDDGAGVCHNNQVIQAPLPLFIQRCPVRVLRELGKAHV